MENSPFIDGLPIKNGDFPIRYVSLPEGTLSLLHWHQQKPTLETGSKSLDLVGSALAQILRRIFFQMFHAWHAMHRIWVWINTY